LNRQLERVRNEKKAARCLCRNSHRSRIDYIPSADFHNLHIAVRRRDDLLLEQLSADRFGGARSPYDMHEQLLSSECQLPAKLHRTTADAAVATSATFAANASQSWLIFVFVGI
jgi:hypothetical protein